MTIIEKHKNAALAAMTRAIEKAADKHRLMGVPMVTWKNGKPFEFIPRKKRAASRK